MFLFLNDITSTSDLKNRGTEGCLYKICSRSQYHHFVDDEFYCNTFITVNNYIDKDITDRLYKGNNNDDCVTIFGNNASDDDIQSVANTLKSMCNNTLFERLPDYNIVEDFLIPESEPLGSITLPTPIKYITLPTPSECTINDDVSVDSNISEDCSGIIPVNENIKQYLMKSGNCGSNNCTTKTLDFGHNFYQFHK